MDILYGNDGQSYRVLAESAGISRAVKRQLLECYTSYIFPRDRFAYSAPDFEPRSVYYQTSDLNGQLDGDYMILAQTGRMRKFNTPSTCAHIHLEKIGPDFFKNDFFRIFNHHLLTDKEILNYQDTADFHPDFPELESVTDRVNLEDGQIRMVLYQFFYNQRYGRPVRIILDATGDAYNERSREVLATIYRYLPYDFRRRFGFISYMAEGQAGLSKIGFELYDRAQLKNPGDCDIDLKNSTPESAKSGIGMVQFTDYADYLVGLSDAQREEHFEALEKLANGEKLNIQDAVSFYAYEKDWRSGAVDELFDKWVSYYAVNKRRGGAAFESLMKIVSGRISEAPDYYGTKLAELMQKEGSDLLSFSENVKNVIAFSDGVDSVSLDFSMFEDAYDAMNDAAHREADLSARCELLRENCRKLKELDLGAKFEEILKNAVKYQEEELAVTERERSEREKELAGVEMRQAEALMAAQRSFRSRADAERIQEGSSALTTEAAKTVIRNGVTEGLEQSLERLGKERVPELDELDSLQEFMTLLSDVIGSKEEDYTKQLEKLRARRERLSSVQKPLKLQSNRDLVDFVEQYISKSCDCECYGITIDSIPVDFGTVTADLSFSQCSAMARFVCAPSDPAAERVCVDNFRGCRFLRAMFESMDRGGLIKLSNASMHRIAKDLGDPELLQLVKQAIEQAAGGTSADRAPAKSSNPPLEFHVNSGQWNSREKKQEEPSYGKFSSGTDYAAQGRREDTERTERYPQSSENRNGAPNSPAKSAVNDDLSTEKKPQVRKVGFAFLGFGKKNKD